MEQAEHTEVIIVPMVVDMLIRMVHLSQVDMVMMLVGIMLIHIPVLMEYKVHKRRIRMNPVYMV